MSSPGRSPAWPTVAAALCSLASMIMAWCWVPAASRRDDDPGTGCRDDPEHDRTRPPGTARMDEVDGLPVLRIDVPAGDPGPVGTRGRDLHEAGHRHDRQTGVRPDDRARNRQHGDGDARAASPPRLLPAPPTPILIQPSSNGSVGCAGWPATTSTDSRRGHPQGSRPRPARPARSASVQCCVRLTQCRCSAGSPTPSFCSRTSAPHPILNRRMVGPLLWLAEELRTLTDERNSVVELIAGLHRVEVSLIPSVTRREAVANALVHRDYAALGPGRVQITDSGSFVVSNPGGFPPGVTIREHPRTVAPTKSDPGLSVQACRTRRAARQGCERHVRATAPRWSRCT